ncbi:ribosome biogenesis protein NOP53 [Anabrus simplex]|uniref:ribosome biogenesis protein NOP53 n=1 Tax=Anabrus simplex TaxID=316456 RepID=UPI0034DCF5E6
MAPQVNRKRVSKKKKIAWRKHCDTKDVENFLEDKRFEERLGFTFSEKPDEELFQIDKTADYNNKEDKAFEKSLWAVDETENTDVKSRRREKLKKPLKCFEILIPQSAVKDPVTKRNRVRTPEERKNPIVKKFQAERRRNGILKAKEIDAIRNRALAESRRKNKPKRGEFTKDLWAGDCNESDPLGGNAEWLTPATLQYTLKNTGQMKKRVPKSLKKKSCLPAVEPPHPGMSYNPTFGDHQDLLRAVANKEMALIKEEQHLDRVTSKMFSKVSRADKEKSWLSEMSEGLPKTQEASTVEVKEEDTPGEEQSNEYTTVNPPVKNKKKTVQQRKKQKVARQEALQRKQRLVEKKKISDIYKLKLLEKQFESRERKLVKLREKRERMKLLKANEPKRLSKAKFEAPELEFNMPTDLKGSLRCVKMEGNLLNDRFKSLQRRNVVEPSVKHHAKKGKKKVFQKASHRMDWEV